MDQIHKTNKWIFILAGLWLLAFVVLIVWYVQMAKNRQVNQTNQARTQTSPTIVKSSPSPEMAKSEVNVGLYSPNEKLTPQKQVLVEVKALTAIEDLSSGDFVFNYDPKVLKFDKIANRKFDDVLFIRNDDKAGELFISAKNNKPLPVLVNEDLISLEFLALSKKPTSLSLVFDGVGKSTDTNIVTASYPGEDALVQVDPAQISW